MKVSTPKPLASYLKELGWDEPEYGWTREKEILKSIIESARREERQRVVEMIEGAKYKREIENRWVRDDGYWCNEEDAQLINEDLSELQSKLEKV